MNTTGVIWNDVIPVSNIRVTIRFDIQAVAVNWNRFITSCFLKSLFNSDSIASSMADKATILFARDQVRNSPSLSLYMQDN